MDSFLAVFVFVVILIAFVQDLKRREVDNWLNLFLLFGSAAYIFYRSIFGNPEMIFHFELTIVLMFAIMNLFYYGRVFGGGDAALLFAMSGFLMGTIFFETLLNIASFILLLMISGSVYGFFYSTALYFKNRKEVNKDLRQNFQRMKIFVFSLILAGIFLSFLGLLHPIFFVLGVVIVLFPFLFVFAKSLENMSMIKEISGKELREGDWLAEDVQIGKKIIRSNWEGLEEKEIELLRKKKKIKIKDGLPFVPAFLIAFIAYIFLRQYLVNLVL